MSLFDELTSAVSGTVLRQADDDFAAYATGFNLAVSHTPEAIVIPQSAADIVATVRIASASGVLVAVQATGHGAHRVIDGGVLINTSRLDGVSVDADARTATLQAGVEWGAVVAAAAPYGLAPIIGSSPTVGAVGFLVGGGLGPLARSHGFGSDYVSSFDVVTGQGELVTASATEHPDLFWALRGGKGGLGIVTSVTIRLVDLPELYAGALFYDFEHADAVVAGWIEWAKTAPDLVTTNIAVFRFPPLDVVPQPLRGRHLISLRFAFPGPVADGEAFAAPLRALAPVYMDLLGALPLAEVARIHSDPTEPGNSWTSGLALQNLDADFARTFVRLLGDDPVLPFIGVELRSIGGATRIDVAEGSAVGGRDLDWTLMVIGAPDPSLFERVLPGAFAGFRAAIAPWISPQTTINWADPHDPQQFAAAWPVDTAARLVEVRSSYDPHGVLPYGPH